MPWILQFSLWWTVQHFNFNFRKSDSTPQNVKKTYSQGNAIYSRQQVISPVVDRVSLKNQSHHWKTEAKHYGTTFHAKLIKVSLRSKFKRNINSILLWMPLYPFHISNSRFVFVPWFVLGPMMAHRDAKSKDLTAPVFYVFNGYNTSSSCYLLFFIATSFSISLELIQISTLQPTSMTSLWPSILINSCSHQSSGF